MARVVAHFLLVVFAASRAAAVDVSENELARPPSIERVSALQAEAAQAGWSAVAPQLREVAVRLYEKNGPQAQAWFHLYRWARLFGLTEAQAVSDWGTAIKQAKAGHANMAQQYRSTPQPLADFWPSGLQAYAMSSPEFSDQFFSVLSPLDQPTMVMGILGTLWVRNPAEFRDYANLAIAIAVVYDVPPPPTWPHGQVSAQALPRKFVPPAEVFEWFVKADQSGATLHHLRQLPAAELKFVVDTGAGLDEMAWAQKNVQAPLAFLAKVYDAVRYRRDRLQAGIMSWPQATYTLPLILQEGGLCVDQAYFAAMVGKAKGVPTLLFRGAGLDGRHAWFGFLDAGGRWQLDCGRYAEQKLVAGFAFDPQSWLNITDHELAFLTDGFRRLPLFRTSRMHAQFAELYWEMGNLPAAVKAARTAVNLESRNLDAWHLLIAVQTRLNPDPRPVENLLEEAARAFQRYPDVESEFKTQLSRSLRARGQASAADFAERSTAHKYEPNRSDLSIQQAKEVMQRSLDNDDARNRIRAYNNVLTSYGRGAGMDFFDQIVRPFAERLLQNDQPRDALQAIEQARRTLRVEPNSQLEIELNQLSRRAQQAVH
jgi:hypothetical protein